MSDIEMPVRLQETCDLRITPPYTTSFIRWATTPTGTGYHLYKTYVWFYVQKGSNSGYICWFYSRLIQNTR